MVLPSRQLSLAETLRLACVQTTQPCGTRPAAALPALHPVRIPRKASHGAPVGPSVFFSCCNPETVQENEKISTLKGAGK